MPTCAYHGDAACPDVIPGSCLGPHRPVSPAGVRAVLISECVPANPGDWYDADDDPLFARTTIQAFRDAGAEVSSIREIEALGFRLTSAVRCAKAGPGLKAGTVERCSHVLEREIAPFTQVQVWLLMGDVAIRAVNGIARRNGEGRVIPAGSTYKIRAGEYRFRGGRAFPSYLQAGPAFFVEKSKREMIAQDIRAALEVVRG
jgi:uracil-DNA glycosylase